MMFKIACTVFLMSMSLHAGLQEYKGVQAYRKGNFQVAQEKLQQALINNPHDVQLLYNNGSAAYRLKEYDKAVSFFKKASEISKPKDPLYEDTLYNLATSYAQQEQLQEALQTFNKLLRQNPYHERAVHNKQVVEQLMQKKEQEQQQQEQKEDSKSQQKKDKSEQKQGNKPDQKDGSKGGQDQQGEQDQEEGDRDGQDGNQEQQSGTQKGKRKQEQQDGSEHNDNLSEKSGSRKQQKQTESSKKDSQRESQQKSEGQDNQDVDQHGANQNGSNARKAGDHKNLSELDKNKKGTAGDKKAQQNKEPLYAAPAEEQDTQEDKNQPEYQLLKSLDKAEQEVGKDLFKTMTRAHMKGARDGQKNW